MSNIIQGIPTGIARHLQRGGSDVHGRTPERHISDGNGNPCRHCLGLISKGEAYLIVAHSPFTTVQPYAETGPIFLHAEECQRYQESGETTMPSIFEGKSELLLRGYDENERIVYGSGKVVATSSIRQYADALFANAKIRFVHVRSASNNCYQARIDRV